MWECRRKWGGSMELRERENWVGGVRPAELNSARSWDLCWLHSFCFGFLDFKRLSNYVVGRDVEGSGELRHWRYFLYHSFLHFLLKYGDKEEEDEEVEESWRWAGRYRGVSLSNLPAKMTSLGSFISEPVLVPIQFHQKYCICDSCWTYS